MRTMSVTRCQTCHGVMTTAITAVQNPWLHDSAVRKIGNYCAAEPSTAYCLRSQKVRRGMRDVLSASSVSVIRVWQYVGACRVEWWTSPAKPGG